MLKYILICIFQTFIVSKTSTWDMSKSSVEVSTDSKIIESELTFGSTTIQTYTNNSQYYMIINENGNKKEKEVPFPSINSYVVIYDVYYICPSGIVKPNVFKYTFSTDNLQEMTELPVDIKNNNNTLTNWEIQCFYTRKDKKNNLVDTKTLVVSYLGTKWTYWYNKDKGGWGQKIIDVSNYLIDVQIPKENEPVGDIYVYYCYLFHFNNGYQITYGKLEVDESSYEPKWVDLSRGKSIFDVTNYGTTRILRITHTASSFELYLMSFGDGGYSFYSTSSTDSGNSFTEKKNIILTLDFSPETFTILDFDFINQSTNFYYKIKTTSNEIYWGYGELLTSDYSTKIVFNSKDIINSITHYYSSPRGGLVTTNTDAYFVCPYVLSTTTPYTCDTCQSGTFFFLNPNNKNSCISPIETTIECPDSKDTSCTPTTVTNPPENMEEVNGEYQCITGTFPHESENKCVGCNESGGYIILPGNSCEKECDESKGIKELDSNDQPLQCTYCYQYTEPQKYLYNGNCIELSQKPSNTFISNSQYNIVSACDSICGTCEDTATNCLTCEGNYYKVPNANECTNSNTPPKGYENFGRDKTDISNQKWINCYEEGNEQYKYVDEVDCISKPSTGVFIVPVENGEINYGLIDRCHANCETCNEKGNENDNKCTKCKENTYSLNSVCVNQCDNSRYYVDGTNRICVNCKLSDSFRYDDGNNSPCVKPQPANTLVIDNTFNIIQNCNSKCNGCSAISTNDDDPKCTSCANSLYVTPDGKCVDECDDSLYQDSSSKKCINCKAEYPDDKPYKLYGKDNQCISESEILYAYYYQNESTGSIILCGSTCVSCNTPPTDTTDNCETCKLGEVLTFDSKKCATSCGDYHVVSDDGFTCTKCGDDQYKFINETFCTNKTTIDFNNHPYYIINPGNDTEILGYCYESCATCSTGPSDNDSKHNCNTCKEGYIQDGTNCVNCDNDKMGVLNSQCVNCNASSQIRFDDNPLCVDPNTITEPIYPIDEEYAIYGKCHSNCALCNTGPTKDADGNDIEGCESCKDDLLLKGSNCVRNCEELGTNKNGKECVNCATLTPSKYNLNGVCQDSSYGYYISDDTYNILSECNHSLCADCENSSTECTACNTGFVLQYKEPLCVNSCNSSLIEEDQKCVNCFDKGMYKYQSNTTCITLPDTPTYITDSIFNIIDNCEQTCLTCEESANKCTSCEQDKVLTPSNTCDNSCPQYYGTVGANNKCVLCHEEQLYIEKNTHECVGKPSEPYVITEQNMNEFELCNGKCASCRPSSVASSEDNCITCKEDYYLQPDSSNCKENCPEKYLYINNKCVNCKNEGKYRYESDTTCTLSEKPSNTFFVDEVFNIIAKCSDKCKECENSPENCTGGCSKGYYLHPTSLNTCIEECPGDYAKYNATNECINCASQNWFKDPNEDYCLTKIPEGYYVADNDKVFNKLSKCYDSCSLCTSKGNETNNQCTKCKSGYEPDDNTQQTFNCKLTCVYPNKWYYDSTNSKVCLFNGACPSSKSILVDTTNQCVESCSASSSCELCKTTNLYLENGKCIEECSKGYKKNDTKNTCDLIAQKEDNGCSSSFVNEASTTVSNKDITSELNKEINNYIDIDDNSNVRIIQTPTVSYLIYRNERCGYELSQKYNFLYSNLTECVNKLKTNNIIGANENIIIGQVQITRESESTNQAGYYIAREDGTKIDLDMCSNINIQISYPLKAEEIAALARSSLFSSKGIDLNNPNDSFFNDICFPFDDNGKDVTLKERRKYYFENNTLCEEGCDYVQINFNSSRVDCSCPIKSETLDKINENIPFDVFPIGSINMETLKVLKCYNLIFDWKHIKHNYGHWIIFSLFICQVITAINFIFIGFSPLFSFLNQFMRENFPIKVNSNPPIKGKRKQTSKIIEEDDEEEEEEEEEEKEEEEKEISKFDSMTNSQNFQSPFPLNQAPKSNLKKLSLNKVISVTNNYVVKDSPCAPISSKVSIYKDTELAMKETERENEEQPEFENDELDELAYEDALEYDHRNICIFYLLTLRNNLILISVFSNINVFEPFCIKLIGFFLNIASFFALNALLFDEDYIAQRFESTESIGFGYLMENEFPRCIYASFAAIPITFLINYLSNAKKRFDTLMKKEKNDKEFLAESKKIVKNMRQRIIIFFVITVILMGFFWYYVSAFCSVYKQTQVAWIEGTMITLLFCIVIYSFLYFLVALMRYIGLKCHLSCFYTLSSYFI